MMFSRCHILLTVDVEDWFQVENLRPCCPISSWSSYELRVEKNTHRILDLLDEMSGQLSAVSGQPFAQERIRQDQQDKKEMSSGSTTLSQFRQETEKKSGRSCKSCLTSSLLPQAKRSSSEALLQPPTSGPVASALNNKSDESCKSCLTSSSQRIRATFFVLGWIAERLPNLVREIHSRGHEVASHGYHHDLCSGISRVELRRDLLDSKKLLEDILGDRVYGYRAPNFSVSDEILRMISEAGYEYDSSYNSFAMHGRYGKISLNGAKRSGIAILLNQKSAIENHKFYELPISNLKVFPSATSDTLAEGPERSRRGTLAHFRHFCLPWGGGAYFRLIPSWVFRMGVREILRQQQGYLFYMHPWEVDPEQPRPEGTTAFSRFKHYTNLSRTEGKLRSLLEKFQECCFVSCHEHLEAKGKECWNNVESEKTEFRIQGVRREKRKIGIVEQ